MSTATEVNVRHFARVYVEKAGQLPPNAEAFKSERGGYYYRLHLDNLPTDGAGTLVQKAAEHFEVEVVGQVIENGIVTKERRYVESPAEVPEGYAPQHGPQGGVYYETNPLRDPSQASDPEAGDVTADTGYDGEPMLAVQFEDVEEGDRIAYETENDERDMGRVIALDDDKRIATVESGSGTTEVAAAPLKVQTEKEDAGITSGTEGAHNDVYGGVDFSDECRRCGENERQEGSMYCAECEEEISKAGGIEPWTSYTGPRGGQGWINQNTGEIRYQESRPSGSGEKGTEPPEGGFADGWSEAPDDPSGINSGQPVEFTDGEAYYGGVVKEATEDGLKVEAEGGEEQTLPMSQVTAVGDDDVSPIGEKWSKFEQGDQQFLDTGDQVAFEQDGERVEGEIAGIGENLFRIDTGDFEDTTIEPWDIEEYQRDTDDLEETRQELREHAEKQGINEHNKAIENYTNDNLYREYQEQLRTAEEKAKESPFYEDHPRMETISTILATTDEDTARTLKDIQSAAGQDLPEQMTVYRGIDVDDEEFLDQAEEAAESGEVMSDYGFQSASIDEDVAGGFGNVTLEITTDHGAYVRAASEYAGEDEVLLPAGTEYHIEEVDRENNRIKAKAGDSLDLGAVDVGHIRETMKEEDLSYGEAVERVV